MVGFQEFKDFVMLRNNVSVTEICEQFKISESTARRLLTKLEDKKLIKRYHGGAYSIIEMADSESIQSRMKKNFDKKLAIAKEACKFIENGSTVIMLGGTTVYFMCRFLKGRDLTIITNSLVVFSELRRERRMQIILLGGLFDPVECELGGIITNNSMRNVRADYMFMGSTGFDAKLGFSTKEIASMELYHTCIYSSKQIFVLADSSKYNAGGTAITARHSDVHCLITDSQIDAEVLRRFEVMKFNVIIANDTEF